MISSYLQADLRSKLKVSRKSDVIGGGGLIYYFNFCDPHAPIEDILPLITSGFLETLKGRSSGEYFHNHVTDVIYCQSMIRQRTVLYPQTQTLP